MTRPQGVRDNRYTEGMTGSLCGPNGGTDLKVRRTGKLDPTNNLQRKDQPEGSCRPDFNERRTT